MENKTRGNGKTKKVVIGVATIVAVAAIAVPTALTLTGGNKDDAGANQGNKYNIVVSCGIDGVSDYSLSVSEGTKISELKSILKGVDGYRIEGIYKDDAMNHPYSDNETISSSTKIYIKFVAVVYTVNIYAEDGTTLVSTQEVNHKDSLSLVAPTKPEDNFATYEFKGWYNERNELVNLNEITSDLNIHPYFETHMKDYRIGFIYEAFKSSISVTIGGTPVTLDSAYHYGAKIVIRATQKVGRDITEFKVKVGSGETQNILTEAYRHEENGVVYYEYELDGNGDLSITYNEAASEYSIGNIPEQVTVTRNGHTLSSNEKIYYGDRLEITYPEDYNVETFEVSGANIVPGTENTYSVTGNINIIFEGTYKYAYLTFIDCAGGVEVSGFDNSVTDVIIPATYQEKRVVSIGESAFENSNSLRTIVLPSTITKIGSRAFAYCESLQAITIPESVVSIGSSAFYYCRALTELTIPDSVTNIETAAFTNCEGLTKITLSRNITIIENSLFANCISLSQISLPEKITSIAEYAFNECTSLKTVTIPNRVSRIGANAFDHCSSLTEIAIPNNVTIIENHTFYCCTSLAKVTLPQNITSIGMSAFASCQKLQSITIPQSVTSIGASAFSECSSLKNISIPQNVTALEWCAFYGCTSLTTISLPEKLTKIATLAFGECTSLASITIPSSVSIIEATAFEGCTKLATVTINSLTIYSGISGDSSNPLSGLIANATEIRVPKSHLEITQNAYLTGENFASYEDGDYYMFVSINKFSHLTFTDCDGGCEVSAISSSSIINVIIPELYAGKKVVGIKDGTYHCGVFSYINSILLPKSLKKIGNFAFQLCRFSTVVLPEGLEEIGENAFYECNNLINITIPNSVKTIGKSAFDGCNNLKTITVNSREVYLKHMEKLIVAPEIKILSSIDDGTSTCRGLYHPSAYTITSEGEYNIYTKNN